MPIFFDDFGALGRGYQSLDSGNTPLGPTSSWSETLLRTVDLMLHTRFPVTLFWGPEFALVYNEAYVHLIGDKHPSALGRPAHEVFPEVWELIGPMMHAALEGQAVTWVEDEYVPLYRHGFLEECFFTFSYSPVRGSDGVVEGVMDIATETTEQVVTRRRLQLLSRLAERLVDVQRPEDVSLIALPLLRAAVRDLPAVDIRLQGAPGAPAAGLPSRPRQAPGVGSAVVETHADTQVAWLSLAPRGSWEQSYLVVSLSPLLAPDDTYLGFLELVSATLRHALDRVRAAVAERQTAGVQRSLAEALQRSLLGQPETSGHPAVAVRYLPAVESAQIGGDWYDIFQLPDKSLAVVIGDVAGHDQHAAVAMAEVRSICRGVAYTMHPDAPSRMLRGLDHAMQGLAKDVFATAILAHVRAEDGGGARLRWSNAGHPPPVLIQPSGTTRLLDTTPDLLLGLNETTHRADHQIALQPGATVVFYTDGLVERRGVPLTDGLAWLVDTLAHVGSEDPEELCDRLLAAADPGEDDVALLVLRA